MVLNVAPTLMGHPLTKTKAKTTCPTLTTRERSELLKTFHKDSYEELHWTFWLIPYLQQSKYAGLAPTAISENTPARSTYLYGPKKCPRENRVDNEFDCPAQYVMHNDVNRIPENIVYAKCVCERCRHAKADHAKECQPVYTLTEVLRRKSDCTYDWTYDKVPVACTCKSKGVIVKSKEVNGKEIPIVPESEQNIST